MRDVIEKNLYLNNSLRCVALSKYNKKVQDFIDRAAKIDSIMDFCEFKDFIKEFKKVYSGGIFSIKKAYSESLLYGHINEVFHYAELDEKDFLYFPIMEHGIQFYMQIKKNHQSRIFQGEYFMEDWNKAYPGTPTFAIGPYVHYARPYYSETEFNKIKEEIGKTLLVFPTHSYELGETHYNAEDFVDYVMQEQAKDYQTVMVCAYWADLDHEIYRLFEARGAKIVSAGFRGDYNFIRRLRTIIELSDGVVANSLGTFVGYCIYFKKPVVMVDGKIIKQLNDLNLTNEMSGNMDKIEQLFYKEFSPTSKPFSKEQIELCEKYWGLSNVKSPEEIRAILQLNKKVIKKALGNVYEMGKAANTLKAENKFSELEKRVLEGR